MCVSRSCLFQRRLVDCRWQVIGMEKYKKNFLIENNNFDEYKKYKSNFQNKTKLTIFYYLSNSKRTERPETIV